ncbi:hypothetical protein SS50377_24943 [Spironucleus salmonicida]|uniref:Uncharacterized protein n=1 Tax=Spironucleus salmonicida TaxID=348837 RepID=V6LGN4_9EUKA|nr:hypothetical protein SS50377_24943 [Spironucleus salmonicida]|eukprot:EST43473.1 Hypothetical protein SS50377_16839 [Spironucleus salmonicida]
MILTNQQQKEKLLLYLYFIGFDDIKFIQKVFIQDVPLEDLQLQFNTLKEQQIQLNKSFQIYINEDEDEKLPEELLKELNSVEPDIYSIWLEFFPLLSVQDIRKSVPDQKIIDIKGDMKTLITHTIERISEFLTKSKNNIKLIAMLTDIRRKVNQIIINIYYIQADEDISDPYTQSYMGILSPKLLKYCLYLTHNYQNREYLLPNIAKNTFPVLTEYGLQVAKKIEQNSSISLLLNEVNQIMQKEAEKNEIIKEIIQKEEKFIKISQNQSIFKLK